jgi:hypothetical protein
LNFATVHFSSLSIDSLVAIEATQLSYKQVDHALRKAKSLAVTSFSLNDLRGYRVDKRSNLSRGPIRQAIDSGLAPEDITKLRELTLPVK